MVSLSFSSIIESGKYDRKADVQSLYEVVDGKGKAPFFRGVDRIKLMKSIFENTVSEGGAGLNIQKMLETGKPHLLAIFPLHDYNELSALQNEWLILYDWPSQQPFTKIRYAHFWVLWGSILLHIEHLWTYHYPKLYTFFTHFF